MTKLSRFIIKHQIKDGYSIAYAVEKLAQFQRCSQNEILVEALSSTRTAHHLIRFAERMKGN
jgi:hypothetical protein